MNKALKVLAIASVGGALAVTLISMTTGWLNGTWIATYRFNDYNEGMIELLFAWITLPLIIWYFVDDIKTW